VPSREFEARNRYMLKEIEDIQQFVEGMSLETALKQILLDAE
jgi:hypothetical protein